MIYNTANQYDIKPNPPQVNSSKIHHTNSSSDSNDNI